MELNALSAISPIDGRYRTQLSELSDYFSEFALIKYRVWVEIEYFIALCESGLPELKKVDSSKFEALRQVYLEFSNSDAEKIKATEKITNHDVKAVEYFVKEKIDSWGLTDYKEFIHFGLTSQDINNTSIPAMLRDAVQSVIVPFLEELIAELNKFSEEWKSIPMLARTHGQPASPTKLGKEFRVFIERLQSQIAQLRQLPFSAKFGGATGNFNAHHVCYPEIDWSAFGNHFVNHRLGLRRSQYTTQIEHYDNIAAICHVFVRINTILIDFSRDVWAYISMNYFKQKIKEGEVGSSAMPHKVNPIDFENAEGNLGIANAVFEHLAAKLPVSRLQRDLTDSTVLRNIGVPFAHTLLALKSLRKGMSKLILNNSALEKDLEDNWAVVAEALQSILRKEGYPQPYEALKGLTRTNEVISQKLISDFVDSLNVSNEIKERLKSITPHNYTGIF